MKVLFTEEAAHDLEAAVSFVALRNPEGAQRLAERVLRLTDQLAARGFEGVEQELTTGERVRSWPVPPFRIYQQRRAEALVVLRIYHQARQPITR